MGDGLDLLAGDGDGAVTICPTRSSFWRKLPCEPDPGVVIGKIVWRKSESGEWWTSELAVCKHCRGVYEVTA